MMANAIIYYRPRVPPRSVSVTPSRTLSADVAETVLSTTKRRLALPAVILPPRSVPVINWSVKAKRRKTTGTGRMRHLKDVSRRFKNGFREGTQAKKQVQASA
ncbi:hypothetical protein INT43_000843 [Umbelopsis isabellina]|uniref:60S ribosomal protein L37 n=1 Tax=Mortierella isabellina TaxID=91625 RepID=A0A8H7Q3M2_MORIS|nr:hypothetical protein INT43_000843 [Umbelopsis isabellina]